MQKSCFYDAALSLQDLVEGGGYQAHVLTVQYFVEDFPVEKRADAKVFDAGAGTGMVARGVCIRLGCIYRAKKVTCRLYTAILNFSPYMFHSADYIFLSVLSDQRGYSEGSEKYYRNRFIF